MSRIVLSDTLDVFEQAVNPSELLGRTPSSPAALLSALSLCLLDELCSAGMSLRDTGQGPNRATAQSRHENVIIGSNHFYLKVVRIIL